MSTQSERTGERRLYGSPQHGPTGEQSPETRYGTPQHETDVERHFSAAEIEADRSRDSPDADRSSRPDPDPGRARARPAGD